MSKSSALRNNWQDEYGESAQNVNFDSKAHLLKKCLIDELKTFDIYNNLNIHEECQNINEVMILHAAINLHFLQKNLLLTETSVKLETTVVSLRWVHFLNRGQSWLPN